jgi:hypothetical protein
MKRRSFLSSSVGIGLGLGLAKAAIAQPAPSASPRPGRHREIPHRKAKTTRMFKAPGFYPNALAVAPEGLWIGQQKLSVEQAREWNQPVPTNRDEAAWLVDWNGKLLKTITTKSRNTSGMAYGNGCVWMCANTEPQGIFQTDMNSNLVRHLQIPLGVGKDGGGCHGAQWHNDKLWIVANRLRALMRVDPKTWTPEAMIPIHTTPELPRWHDMTFDAEGFIWQVIGNDSQSFSAGRPGLVKYDANTGEVLLTVEFVGGSCDPHGLEFHNGALISCDAGLHPGWSDMASPDSGYIFRIDLI